MWVVSLLLGGLAALCLALSFYLLILTFQARRAWPVAADMRIDRATPFFSILVPAHDEAQVLPALLASLAALDYPREAFQVHVVADNCTDATAAIARDAGADVHERFDKALRGKGHALDWLTSRLRSSGARLDYVVIVDGDCVVSPNLLKALARRVAENAQAIQVRYSVSDPGDSWSKALRSIGMSLINFVRPLGRSSLGGSAGLKGTGMMFSSSVIAGHRWGPALAEDAQLSLDLTLRGTKVAFAPEAEIVGHVPSTLKGAETQNTRWEAGRLALLKDYGPRLVTLFLRTGQLAVADALVDLLMPPLSILGAMIVLCLAGSWIFGLVLPLSLACASLACMAIHVVLGMSLSGARRVHYEALIMAPLFVAWKLRLYVPMLLGKQPAGWVKTERD